MNIGDEVSWKSQAAGTMLRKKGTIVAIVDADQIVKIGAFTGSHDTVGVNLSKRTGVSYLISVPQKKGKRPKLYRPSAHLTLRKKTDGTSPIPETCLQGLHGEAGAQTTIVEDEFQPTRANEQHEDNHDEGYF